MSMAHTQTDAFSVNRAGSGRREMVGFRVGDQAFCIDITSVLEIRGWTPATPVPQPLERCSIIPIPKSSHTSRRMRRNPES